MWSLEEWPDVQRPFYYPTHYRKDVERQVKTAQ
jgi:hypothetical protein